MKPDRNGKSSVGVNVPRLDGPAKVTGTARYLADLPAMPGELIGATVRSPVPRGRLSAIELDPTFDWSAVTVVTAADVPDNVVALFADDQPVLAATRVNHRYEPVALLACEDRALLERATRAVRLDIEPLPAVLDLEAALRADPVVWGEDNVMRRYLITKGRADEGEAAIDAALSACEVVVSGRYTTHHQEHVYLEPQGMLAWWDGRGLHVTGSLQCPHFVLNALARSLALGPERVHVTQAVTGGAFGGKEEYPSVVAIHAALLAQKSGRPVRLCYDRVEDIEASTKRHPSRTLVSTGCDRDGTLRVLKLSTVFDAGAYVTITPVVLARGALHAGGAYRWQDVRIEGRGVATNTPPNGAFRGFGAPQTIWAIERHLDRVARTLGIDPGELKRRNLLEPGDTTTTGQLLRESVGGQECLAQVFARSDYLAKRARGPRIEGRKARGVGMSVFLHGSGFTGSGEKRLKGKAAVDLRPGGRLRVRASSTDIGQGTETVFAQIAADAAGLPLADVEVATPCTSEVPDSGPTVASRTVMVVGSIVQAAAAAVMARVEAARRPAESLAAAADRLLAAEGEVTELRQYEPPEWVSWDEERYRGDAYPVFAWMCDVAEVVVDLDTFEVAVERFWSATDVGKAIHPLMCQGQLEGGNLQAIGWALSEELVWDRGAIVNPRLASYIVPTALDAPAFDTLLVEQPYRYGPGGGAKGIGELPMDGGAAAVAAAVEHATGIALDALPLTPERLWEASRAGREEA